MADEARLFIVTIPAGTSQAAPATEPVKMPPRRVERISYRVPHGSQGLLGWQLAMGGVQVLPTAGVTWVTGEDIAGEFTVDHLPDSGDWQLVGYNTGGYPHAVYLTFHVSVPARPAPPPGRWTIYDLDPVPDLSRAGPPVRRRP